MNAGGAIRISKVKKKNVEILKRMISILINYANYFISLSRVLIIILKKEKALRRLIEKGMDPLVLYFLSCN